MKIESSTAENSYKCLGITLKASGTAFTLHIKEKTLTAIRDIVDSLSKLSLETAMKLFDLKMAPILTYGLTVTWEHLGENSRIILESEEVT
jgi:P2-related tail formation protein